MGWCGQKGTRVMTARGMGVGLGWGLGVGGGAGKIWGGEGSLQGWGHWRGGQRHG